MGECESPIVQVYEQRRSPISSVNGVACPVCQGKEFQPVWRNMRELRFGIPDRFSVGRCVVCDTHMIDPLPVQTYLNDLCERHYLPAQYVPPDRTAIVAAVKAFRAGHTDLLDRWRRDCPIGVPGIFYQVETAEFFAGCRNILDVGAYTGENMLWLTAGGWQVTGVETNLEAARVAQQLGCDVRTTSWNDAFGPRT